MRIKFHNKIKYTLLLVLAISINSCSNSKSKIGNKVIKEEYKEIKDTRIKFNYSQSFKIKEIKYGTSISDIHVSGVGFQNSSATIKFKGVEPIENFLIADINSDGFEELYIITRSVGSGAYASIIGISSYKGESYKTIYIPEYDESLDMKFDYLDGYMGHDTIYIKNKKLYREFPVYKPTDVNAKPTGGVRILEYVLNQRNGSFSLQVKYSNLTK